MDVNALRVFNIIHSLNINEEEFADLENEQKHTERTGLYIRCIKKGYSMCVSHDENHQVVSHLWKNPEAYSVRSKGNWLIRRH